MDIDIDQEIIGEGEGTHKSKNQMRKQAKYVKTIEKKKENRKAEQERHREKFKIYRQEGGLPKGDLRNLQLSRLKISEVNGLKVCIDLQFEELMNEKELNHLANQIKRVYSSNKASENPFHLHFINFKKEGKIYKLCCDKNTGFENYVVTFEERGAPDLFTSSEVVYLTPDSENVLESLDTSKVYIIGGLVDDSVKKNTSYRYSEYVDIPTARLPIPEYMTRSGSGSFKQILTINQVFDILLSYQESLDWKTALSLNVPPKTGFVLKTD